MRFSKCILLLFVILPYCTFSQVSIREFPEDFQLYKRDTSTNTGTVTISGDVEISSGFSLFILEIYKDDVLIESVEHPLSYDNTTASFQFSENITAGLFQYSFKLKTDTNIILREASNVVAGDIYIVTGQSNAIRHRYFNAPFPFENTFIRTYLLETQEWSTNPNPYTFGGIGYRFAASIVANQNVPVLLLNGGVGGRTIAYFLRNHENTTDMSTNYGQLLSSYHHANLTRGDVNGIIWFQGEANPFTEIVHYKAIFMNLGKKIMLRISIMFFKLDMVAQLPTILTTEGIFKLQKRLDNLERFQKLRLSLLMPSLKVLMVAIIMKQMGMKI